MLFREIRKIPYENPIFFRDKLYLFFALHCHYTGDTQYRFWFDFDNSLTRWKRFFLIFSKFCNSRNSQNSVWKPIFFLGQLYQQLLALHCHYIGDTPYRVWIDLDNSLTRWKKPIYKIPFSRNSQNSVRKPNFFPRQALPLFCFTLSLHWWYSIPSLVWFGQLLDPMKKIFFKILKISQFAKFAKFRIKTQFFPRHALPKTFLLYTLITLVILHTAFGLIWTTP